MYKRFQVEIKIVIFLVTVPCKIIEFQPNGTCGKQNTY